MSSIFIFFFIFFFFFGFALCLSVRSLNRYAVLESELFCAESEYGFKISRNI